MQDIMERGPSSPRRSECLERIRAVILETLREDGAHATAVPGLMLYRWSVKRPSRPRVYRPSLCVVVQGEKQVWLGSQVFTYNPATYLVSSIHVPVQSSVSRATASEPYLALCMQFDPEELVDLLGDAWIRADEAVPETGLWVARMEDQLLDAIARYVDLVRHPEDVPYLAPLWRREIFYRVIRGEGGQRWARLLAASYANPAHLAVRYLAEHFRDHVRIEDLALLVKMSPSALHRHFKALTNMTPIQYQKRMRLLEARRLLLSDVPSVTEAALSVGYESVSQFTRDYARFFGLPPSKDVKRLRLAP
ncbi:AraC family transcriptional regulator [Alicyclobacillus vulcanalis]|uniref:AraC family transcriptional regulator n=1 Tax=Alicyclobacillus vulcanalis TaxID=252246 RepID=UPI0009FE10D6|nr:AraC family transcriptional regulator [Alicyclobacillus vulcanalis]